MRAMSSPMAGVPCQTLLYTVYFGGFKLLSSLAKIVVNQISPLATRKFPKRTDAKADLRALLRTQTDMEGSTSATATRIPLTESSRNSPVLKDEKSVRMMTRMHIMNVSMCHAAIVAQLFDLLLTIVIRHQLLSAD